ncbi:rRNA maturation RNase YbeY [Galbibacter pacificus]|uniref:Endoribonuclease YbeY n=1 Tax=Galbibacter pacificus TaxID=2996052 RepID=A0ABT6FRI9_9FLAO|nr:rRNA maturation RNase YbeY [Galbibacter pacificus]MDG3582993.1 rRNA maturation RNase YbeY [Galbibacter pacificus]MDG3585888.1 rRNA maturation RNase YbeY [Galbibacter pacificus]
MINFHYETDFLIEEEERFSEWVKNIIRSEAKEAGEINYIFCDDDYLHKINVDYLDHDTFTDIISFDYSDALVIQGDVFVSVERVKENAKDYDIPFQTELKRVMAHGILHYCGFKDKTVEDTKIMREKEEEKIALFK